MKKKTSRLDHKHRTVLHRLTKDIHRQEVVMAEITVAPADMAALVAVTRATNRLVTISNTTSKTINRATILATWNLGTVTRQPVATTFCCPMVANKSSTTKPTEMDIDQQLPTNKRTILMVPVAVTIQTLKATTTTTTSSMDIKINNASIV